MEESKNRIDIWSFFMYLILYSIVGFFIETVFGMITKGVIESRKSFLYGPFCAIYGIGAISMILCLKNQKKISKIFIGGAIIGAFVEYLMSYFCEKFFGVKWWDYSKLWLNIEGRTCIGYAVSWGILAILLIKFVNPFLDKYINKMKGKINNFKIIMLLLIGFFLTDAIISGYALKIFYYKIASENHLNIENSDYIKNKYNHFQEKTELVKFVNKYMNDEKMVKTYPNMMIQERENNMVYVDSLFDGVESYYYRLGDVKK